MFELLVLFFIGFFHFIGRILIPTANCYIPSDFSMVMGTAIVIKVLSDIPYGKLFSWRPKKKVVQNVEILPTYAGQYIADMKKRLQEERA